MPPESGLAESLVLLGKVLEVEIQAGCKNRATTGGIHAFFAQRFAGSAVSEEEHTRVGRVLESLQRYEAASIEERPEIARVIVRRLGATLAQTGNTVPREAREAYGTPARATDVVPSLPADRSRRVESQTPPPSERAEQPRPASAGPVPPIRPQ